MVELLRNRSGAFRAAVYGSPVGAGHGIGRVSSSRTKSTFPPFTPNRVISQDFYRKDLNGAYVLEKDGPWVHSSARQRSAANLHKRIATHNNSCLFVWLSSNTLANRRGSLMVYRAYGRVITSWYSSFSCEAEWRLVRTQGISHQYLSNWLTSRRISPVILRDENPGGSGQN